MSNSAAVIGTPTVQTVTEDSNLQTLVAAGLISISDANAGQAAFKTTVIAASGDLGTLTIAASGAYVYSVADSKVQYLGAGETKVDTFTVTSLDGTTKQVAFTIIGVNDTAVIGAPTVVDVTEDATSPTLKATGSISISDVDQNQAAFKTAVIAAVGNLGTLVLQSNGSYTYSVADSAVQYLGAGQIKTDTFTVTALDGTTKQISFNVHGTNDAAVIGTPTVHDVTEDVTNPTLTATGAISITDADQGQAAFKTSVTSAAGNLGTLVLAANGTYTYSVADSAVQYLGAGDTKVDTFTVTSLDGTQKQVSFTIHGANNAAVIGTPTAHDVTEDATIPIIYAIGTVSISDADQGEAAFQPTLQAGSGNVGALIMGSNGAYIYAVLDSAVQYLGAGDTKVDTFTVTSIDGTTKQITFTVHGANDAAVIGAPTVHDVTEDANPTTLTAAGTISIADVDQNQSSFQTSVIAAAGTVGHLTIAANGAYSYTVSDSAVQYLGASDSKVEIFTVTAFDGTQKQVSFTIHGVNDAAVIGDPTVHDVTKNASPTTLTASGVLTITDADQNQAVFKTTVISTAGNLGQLVIAANGTYTYSVANSATQSLGASDVKVDKFTVTALDGTTKVVSFTIHGSSATNHAAVIGDPNNAVVTEDASPTTLTATGTIPITDADAGQAAFLTGTSPGAGNLGTLGLQSTGAYTYSVSSSAVQFLGAGDTKVDTFTITSVDGTSKVVSFTIKGTNDTAVISDPVSHSVTEDSGGTTLTATGKLTVTDADQGQASFQSGSVAGAGNLGALTFASDGTYIYSVNNSATQSLGASDTHIDTFTVHSFDGTPKVISFTIQGVNDAAVISDPVVHDVTEDASVSPSGNLTASGQLTAADVDQGQSSFQAGTFTGSGNLGSLSLAGDGTYTYSVANSATQSLAAGDTRVDTFTIHSQDGTPKVVSFTIHGANDAAVIGDPVLHDVTEDATAPTLSVLGQLTVTDADHDQSAFSTVVPATPGNLGHLTITADGHYTYSVDNAAVQSLGAGDVRVETFTVSSVDGTAKPISFTIHGTQDAPILTASDASGAADDAAIALNISAAMIDSSGTLGAIRIEGLPDSYSLNHGSHFASDGVGYWEVSATDLATLAIVPGADAHADTLNLKVSVASIEGGHQTFAPADQITVNIAAGAHEVKKFAVDGYIAGAFVFADANGNGVFDAATEASATTNADGSFTLHDPHGTLIMSGGTDVSTGLAFSGTLKAPEGSTVVTPLTTLVTSLVESAAANHVTVSAADAAMQVAIAFGIDPDHIDITTFDPVPAAVAGNTAAQQVLAAGVQVQSTVAQISAVGASQADVFSAIAGAITTAGTGNTIDLSAGMTVAAIVSDSGVTGTAADVVASTVSAANNSIQLATDVTAIAQAGQVAQGAATTQLAAAAATNFSDTTQLATIQDQYVDHLDVQVSAAQVGAVGVAILGTSGSDVLTGTSAIDSIDGLEGNDQISSGDGSDLLFGGAGNDRLAGNAGNDRIDGGQGFDRAIYTDATGGLTINMGVNGASGTVSGAGVDTDTLTNVEGVVGSNFADTYNGVGFTGDAATPGTPIGFNEFEGAGGNDTVYGTVNAQGAALTRVSYLSATSGVTVDIAAGTADGDGSVGHDTFVGPGILSVWGSTHDDTLKGSNNVFGTVEVFAGFAGNDTVDGRGGFDRVDYNQDATTTSGITVHLAAGTVTGDASVGTDTLISVEGVRGTNFADTYDATGFGGTSTNAGSLGTFNEFTGNGGNDTIIGNGATRISFNNATGGVTVDLQTGATPGTGTADGDASVGHDTFSGVNAVQGSMFADTIYGSNNTAATEVFTGNGGNDYIDGRGGFDIASYNNIYLATGGITVDMAAGTVTGDSSIGTDTLRSIEGIQGTNNNDIYVATGYGFAGALNVGNNGQFNQFEGLGGNDTITGNGNTRVIYANAFAAVTVNLALSTAQSTAAGDVAGIGTDTFISGVNSVTGSAFGDTLTGDGNANTFVGGGGNDTIDGGGSDDIVVFTGSRAQYTIIPVNPANGQATVADTVANRDGTDTVTNVEVLQFNNTNLLISSGSSGSPVDLSDNRLFFNAAANPLTSVTGSTNDFIKISQSLSNHQIDLGAGTNDTVILGVTGGYNLNLANVEKLVGTGGDDFVGFLTNVNGLSIDMGGGTDNVNLFNGSNSVSATNIENLNGSDFAAGSVSNDTLTLLNNVSGLSVNLANGVNTLNLAAGANSFTSIFSVDTVNGTAGNDTLTVTGGLFTPNNDLAIDLGGGDDTLQFAGQFFNGALRNVEHLVGGTPGDDFYTLTNNQNGLSVDLGNGNDTLNVANGSNSISVTNVESIQTNDFSGAASNDALTLLNDVSGVNINLQQGINTLNLASGVNSLANIYNVDTITGSASGDTLTVGTGLGTLTNDLSIDLGGGDDTLQFGGQFLSVALNNVEHLVGSAGDDFYMLTNAQNGLTVDLGAGNNGLQIAAGANMLSVTNTQNISTNDYFGNAPAADDTLTLLNDINGVTVNLQQGNNTLNLAAGTNSLTSFNVQHINGTASDDTLTMLNDAGGDSIDLGGGNDTLNLAVSANGVTVANVEHVNGSAGNDFITIANTTGTTTVTGGGGADFITASAAADVIRFTDASESSGAFVDTVNNFDAAQDSFLLDGVANLAGSVHFMASGVLDGSPATPHAEAILANVGGQNQIQIDVDGDGTIGAGDIVINVNNLAGTLSDANFSVVTANHAPTNILLSNATVAENSAPGTVVGALSDTDPDAGDAASYVLIDNAGGQFAISGGNLVTTAPLDFEQAASYQVIVQVTDAAGATLSKILQVDVTNVNEAPTGMTLSNASVLENTPNGIAVGNLAAVDPDAGDSATFTLVDNAGGLFDIFGSQVVVAGALDYEQAASHQITVRETDAGGLTFDKTFTIATINLNEAPTAVLLSNSSVAENQTAGAVVGALSALDPDAGDSATFTLMDNAGGLFAISGGNLVTTAPLDFEQAPSHQVTVRVTDSGGLIHDQSFTIATTNVNEPPSGIFLAGVPVAENSPAGTFVGVVTATDPDVGDFPLTVSLIDDAGGRFALSGNSLVTTGPLDYEQASSYQVTVRAIDGGGLFLDKVLTVNVTNVNEAPTAVLLSNNAVAENSAASTVVGVLSAADPDAGDSASFTLTDNAGGLFAISGGNLVTTAPLNYEQAASHQVTVRVTDSGGLTHDTTFTIATTNVNEAPTDILLSNASVTQSSSNGTVVGALSAVDQDAGDSATFTLTDNAGGQFGISGGNLVVSGALSGGTQHVTVHAVDSGGLPFDKTINVSVITGSVITGDAGANSLLGTAGDDTMQGLGGNDRLQGLTGNDTLDGGQGFDRAIYTDASSAITVNLSAGTVTGGAGSDTLIGIESIIGSNFADIINTAGFTGDSGIAGNPIGLNEIEGGGGDDTITSDVNSQGALLTRISYISAAAGVTVDLALGTAHGTAAGDAAGVGNDTLVGSGFSTVIGSNSADSLLGTNNAAGTVEIFDGRGGNDTLNGRGGFDRADYALDSATASGITVNLGAGTVVGDSTIGSDTLVSIESVRGTNFADSFDASTFTASSPNGGSNGTFNEFNGMGGNDSIIGNGNTRLAFVNATGGVTVDIAAGTDSGDVSTGADTFSGVNAIQASMYNDTLLGSNNATGTETFAGLGGNDFVDGRGGFDLATYNNIYFSTGPVNVNMGAGTATGDASIGTDTLRSIEAIQGTNFNDVYNASTFGTAGALNVGNNGTFNQFEGIGGNDSITGNGNTRIIYSSATDAVSINMQAGTASGGASIGSDTFTAVNSATGSNLADTYNAAGFVGGVGTFNTGNFNLFEGLGGNDTITGNGNTRIAYANAAAAVTVDLSLNTAHGTAGGDVAGVGTDTIIGGVNSVQGSNFNDTIIGGAANETLLGGGGADTINGGGGNDTLTGQGGNDAIDGGSGTDVATFTGAQSGYTISLNTPGAGQVRVVDSQGAARDGTDTLTNVEIVQFSDASVMVATGSSGSQVDVSGLTFGAATNNFYGSAGSDFLTMGQNLWGHTIDMQGGTDTVTLLASTGYTIGLLNTESLIGSSANDFVGLTTNETGLNVDLAGGNDALQLAAGFNSVSVTNVEQISTADFTGTASNDTLTLLNNVTGLTVNLQLGNNTLNLAAGANSLVDIFNVQHINGTASNDTLTLTDTAFEPGGNPIIDLGGGFNIVNVGAQFGALTLVNVNQFNGNALDNGFTLNNNVNGIAVDLGDGHDNLTLAGGVNSLSLFNVENLNTNDFTGTAVDDTVTLLSDVSGLSVNLAQGNNTLNLAAGTNSLGDIFGAQHINGSASNDVLTLSDGAFTPDSNPTIDLGGGDNTLNFGAGNMSITALNIQHISGSAADNSLSLNNDVTGVSIDLGDGIDHLTLATGTNSISVANIESISSSDYDIGSPSNDTLTLLNDVTSLSVDLAAGTNTLNLADGVNSLDNLFGISQLNGSASNDSLTLTQQTFGTVFDMAGGDDVINFVAQANGVTVVNAETVNGSDGNDSITIGNTSGTTTITGGLGSDNITASAAADNFQFHSAGESVTGNGDQVINFDAATDKFVFDQSGGGLSGLTGPIQFIDGNAFDGTPAAHQSEARLDTSGGQTTLQIDVNGDGLMDGNDIEIHLTNLAGTLTNSNFLLV